MSALALHRQLGDQHSEPSTLDSLAYAYRHLGHHVRPRRATGVPSSCMPTSASTIRKLRTLIYAGDAHQVSGDVPGAHDAWTQALAILDDLRHPRATQVRSKTRNSSW